MTERKDGIYNRFVKRVLDFMISLTALTLLSPLFLILTATGAVAMKGNPFFQQARPGRIDPKTGEEKIFHMIKFRSMTNEKDAEGKLLPDTDRLGSYGKILRKTSLDELPQLLNVMLGQCSLIGPRPLLIAYLPYYTKQERRRHLVRPGLTGLAQVNGRNHLAWDDRLKIDVAYVDNVSFMMDLKILMTTIVKVLKRADVAEKRIVPLNIARKEEVRK